MKPNERKEALLAVKENIEMDLFYSGESCELLSPHELNGDTCFEPNLEHPLVCIWQEEPTPEVHARQDALQNPKPNTVTPARENKNMERRAPTPVFMDDTEMEMQVILPPRKSEAKLVELMTTTFDAASLNKASRMKWRSASPEQTGLVVKDMICLQRGHYSDETMRITAPKVKDQGGLPAIAMTARISIDRQWSAKQMESRLVVLFLARHPIEAGQRFSFTYLQVLQCIQGVLFVPVTPAEGWTGAQVLKISGHGPLYILSPHDYLQIIFQETNVSGGSSRNLPRWRQSAEYMAQECSNP
ncbi:uncharacterized protein LOC133504045 isoform X2 [Syngnathoides biaculeatus]|uniref:uncharacterized protein LOC133504045 isoform X2 n=1 Tax=Syngnathoides biaculeatus TaxID=300417 RepID=UPI002ADE95AA|nr:uncharacterized protein LOC133504045 isoform X2 [Syngnathoides biaculeatus]